MDSIHVLKTKKAIKKDINLNTDHSKSLDVLLPSDLIKFYQFPFTGSTEVPLFLVFYVQSHSNSCY